VNRPKKSLQEICCCRLGISADEFERTLLFSCLPPYHRLVGRLVWWFARPYFRPDLAMIKTAAGCTNMRQLNSEVMFYRFNPRISGFQRKFLRARISGRRLLRFGEAFLPWS
jgi:hypothetical protein